MTKIILIGNGAREHAIAKTLVRSKAKPELYAYMSANNPGIADLCKEVKIGTYKDLDSIKEFCDAIDPEFVIIGPEDPLNNGVVDALEAAGIPCVGPKKKLARLETSKSFTREIMKKYEVPGNPRCKTFTADDGLKEYITSLGESVIKPDGLTGGKGVKVHGDHFTTDAEAYTYALEVLESHPSVVVEEKLIGEEFSLMSFTDGEHVVDCPPVQDHKRAYVGDKGPNTGGMGSYSDANHLLPFLKAEHVQQAHDITVALAKALKEEHGQPYKGVMYGGFIVTKEGVKVIEYNARLGDPEAMNVLSIMTSDFVELCRHIIKGTVDQYTITFEKKATVCKYAVPEGYPTKPVKNELLTVPSTEKNVDTFYASVDRREDGLFMTGSRAVAFVGKGNTLEEAERLAEAAVSQVQGKVFHRPDIGTAELIQKRIDHMKEIGGD